MPVGHILSTVLVMPLLLAVLVACVLGTVDRYADVRNAAVLEARAAAPVTGADEPGRSAVLRIGDLETSAPVLLPEEVLVLAGLAEDWVRVLSGTGRAAALPSGERDGPP